MENQNLLEALRTIRGICNGHDTCHDCPLRTPDNTCSVTHKQPHMWKLLGDIEEENDMVFTNYTK